MRLTAFRDMWRKHHLLFSQLIGSTKLVVSFSIHVLYVCINEKLTYRNNTEDYHNYAIKKIPEAC